MRDKPKLEVGKEYLVELYPRTIRVNAKYLGQTNLKGQNKKHFFVSEGETYHPLLDRWMIQDEKGFLTYTPQTSLGILSITKQEIVEHSKSDNENDRKFGDGLLKALNSLGENL